MDPFILEVLGIDASVFTTDSFKPYTISYGYQDYIADFDKALQFRSKRWLKMEFDLSSINDLLSETIDIQAYFFEGPN